MRAGAVVAEGDPVDVLTEDRVTEVFGLDCQIIDGPQAGTPLVALVGRRRAPVAEAEGTPA